MKNIVPIIVQPKSANFLKNIFSGLRKAAKKSEYELEFIGMNEFVQSIKHRDNSLVIVIGYRVDWVQETLYTLLLKGFQPIVVNVSLSPDMLKYYNGVFIQLREGVEQAIKYLCAAGKQCIALLGANSISLADHLKEETFQGFISKHFNEPALIFEGSNPICDCVERFIEAFVEKNIDAVICSSDTVAIYLMNRMIEDGFKIPDDLYVIGMGNTRLGQKIAIPLSTIEFDCEELGRQALRLWRYIRMENSKAHIEVSIPCRFIARASTDNYAPSEIEFTSINEKSLSSGIIESYSEEIYEDDEVKKIIGFEDFLCTCDDTDYRIIEGIMQSKSDEKMTEWLSISDRAIRYRINKMTKKLGVQNREEIVNIIRELQAFN